MQLSIDMSWAKGVNADSFLGNFLRQSDSKRVDRSFARRVVHIFAGRTILRRAGRDIDDPPGHFPRVWWTSFAPLRGRIASNQAHLSSESARFGTRPLNLVAFEFPRSQHCSQAQSTCRVPDPLGETAQRRPSRSGLSGYSVKCACIRTAVSRAPQRQPHGVRGPGGRPRLASSPPSPVHVVRGCRPLRAYVSSIRPLAPAASRSGLTAPARSSMVAAPYSTHSRNHILQFRYAAI